MRRLLTPVLVFVLAGVPVAGVVCDLMLCVTPTQALCHERTATADGARMIAKDGGCDHLALTAPYAAAASRHALDRAPICDVTACGRSVSPATFGPGHGVDVRGSPYAPRLVLVPLRI